MDKSWIKADRDSLQYEIGVENFLIFAEDNAKNPKKIPCPCSRCVNFKKYSVKIIRGHLYEAGFSLGYYEWIWHGEEVVKSTKSSVGSTCPPSKHTLNSETFNVCEAAYNKEDFDNESDEFTLLEQAISRAVKTYNCETGRGNRKPAKAKFLSGSPKQPGGTECAYVVMRYMQEIISDTRLTFAKKWLPKTRGMYTEAQLDEVRIQALKFIQDRI